MAKRATYNAYNEVTGWVIDRFQGVYNDGLGCNLPPSYVDYAENAEDQWRGAVKKRKGWEKYLSKEYPVYSFSNVFEGYYFQGDNDVWYRTDALLDYRRRPGAGGSSYASPFTLTSYAGYTASASSSTPATFTGSPPAGCSEYYTGVDEWRYRHIAIAINHRRISKGLAPFAEIDIPTLIPDASINYIHINNARAGIEGLVPGYIKKDVDEDTGSIPHVNFHNMLTLYNLGGLALGIREWSNVTASGTIVYRNDMIISDNIESRIFLEMEVMLRNLKYTIENSSTNVGRDRSAFGTTPAQAIANAYAIPLASAAATYNFFGSQVIPLSPTNYWARLQFSGDHETNESFVYKVNVASNGNGYPRIYKVYIKSQKVGGGDIYTNFIAGLVENKFKVAYTSPSINTAVAVLSIPYSFPIPPYDGTAYSQRVLIPVLDPSNVDRQVYTTWAYPDDNRLGSKAY